jgi:hypothetical protein
MKNPYQDFISFTQGLKSWERKILCYLCLKGACTESVFLEMQDAEEFVGVARKHIKEFIEKLMGSHWAVVEYKKRFFTKIRINCLDVGLDEEGFLKEVSKNSEDGDDMPITRPSRGEVARRHRKRAMDTIDSAIKSRGVGHQELFRHLVRGGLWGKMSYREKAGLVMFLTILKPYGSIRVIPGHLGDFFGFSSSTMTLTIRELSEKDLLIVEKENDSWFTVFKLPDQVWKMVIKQEVRQTTNAFSENEDFSDLFGENDEALDFNEMFSETLEEPESKEIHVDVDETESLNFGRLHVNQFALSLEKDSDEIAFL